jgi:hypothetical protein
MQHLTIGASPRSDWVRASHRRPSEIAADLDGLPIDGIVASKLVAAIVPGYGAVLTEIECYGRIPRSRIITE